MIYIDDDIMSFDIETALGLLSEQRRKQALRYAHELGRRQCIASYLLLKNALKSEFGIDENPLFEYLEGGKPVLLNHPDIHFNISHCRTAVAIAVDKTPVGVDIETIRPYKETLARHVLSDAEYETVNSSERRDIAFIKYWTRKEATLKLSGEGIRSDLKTIVTDQLPIETVVNEEKGYVYSLITG